LDGLPLLAHSIRYSKNCKLIDYTYVSTDSKKYAEIAIKYGADVPFLRPDRYAKNDSQDYEFMKHALNALENLIKINIDYFVLLRPTSPLRPKGLIEKGFQLLDRFPRGTSVRTVTQSKEHPYRSWMRKGDFICGYESNIKEPYNLPRQKLPEIYFQTGDLEIIRRSTILSGSVSGNKIIPLIINHGDMFDIDTIDDFDKIKSNIESKRN